MANEDIKNTNVNDENSNLNAESHIVENDDAKERKEEKPKTSRLKNKVKDAKDSLKEKATETKEVLKEKAKSVRNKIKNKKENEKDDNQNNLKQEQDNNVLLETNNKEFRQTINLKKIAIDNVDGLGDGFAGINDNYFKSFVENSIRRANRKNSNNGNGGDENGGARSREAERRTDRFINNLFDSNPNYTQRKVYEYNRADVKEDKLEKAVGAYNSGVKDFDEFKKVLDHYSMFVALICLFCPGALIAFLPIVLITAFGEMGVMACKQSVYKKNVLPVLKDKNGNNMYKGKAYFNVMPSLIKQFASEELNAKTLEKIMEKKEQENKVSNDGKQEEFKTTKDGEAKPDSKKENEDDSVYDSSNPDIDSEDFADVDLLLSQGSNDNNKVETKKKENKEVKESTSNIEEQKTTNSEREKSSDTEDEKKEDNKKDKSKNKDDENAPTK